MPVHDSERVVGGVRPHVAARPRQSGHRDGAHRRHQHPQPVALVGSCYSPICASKLILNRIGSKRSPFLDVIDQLTLVD